MRWTVGGTLDDCHAYSEVRGSDAFSYNFDNLECRTGYINKNGDPVTSATNITGFVYLRKYGKWTLSHTAKGLILENSSEFRILSWEALWGTRQFIFLRLNFASKIT